MPKAEFYDLLRSDLAGHADLSSDQTGLRCQRIVDYCRLGGLIYRGFAECSDTPRGKVVKILYMPKKDDDTCIQVVFRIAERESAGAV